MSKTNCKRIPLTEKLNGKANMDDTNIHFKFKKIAEKILENAGNIDWNIDSESNIEDHVPVNAMIPSEQLQDLRIEAAKLETRKAMELISVDMLLSLLGLLEKNIRIVTEVLPSIDHEQDQDEEGPWIKAIRATDASLTVLYILTSPHMQRQVFLEEVIDRVIEFTKYQLFNTIFPYFDPIYRRDNGKDEFASSAKKRRVSLKKSKDKSIHQLNNKLVEVVSLLADLLCVETLTDSSILQLSSIGITSFFVEHVSKLQLSSLKLVVNIFSKYKTHQKLILEDILDMIARLPNSKCSLRSYQLDSKEWIQMLTALVLRLVQSLAVHPIDLEVNTQIDPDSVLFNTFMKANSTASNFLYFFLAKCSNKKKEIDYRPIFENFIQDLLTTLNKPEWPAAEVMLSLLGKLLVARFTNRNLDIPSRLVALEYLGVITIGLRKNALHSNPEIQNIDEIINLIKYKDDNNNVKGESIPTTEKEQIQFLQQTLLDYLKVRTSVDAAQKHTSLFYLTQWYQECDRPINVSPNVTKDGCSDHTKCSTKSSEKTPGDCKMKSTKSDLKKKNRSSRKASNAVDKCKLSEEWKPFILKQILNFDSSNIERKTVLKTCVEYETAELVTRCLASKRPFSQIYTTYLKRIVSMLTEPSVLMRMKAMKCLSMILEVDSEVLGYKDVCTGVNYSFLDHSTAVREAAVDLVGKSILSQPELIDKYYVMLSDRILDTGVSVRKKVIKIFKHICVEHPEYSKIPDICVKIIRRVNDEEGIRKLVVEVFHYLWFTPVQDKDKVERKVVLMNDVVSIALKEMGLDWLQTLLENLFKPSENKEVVHEQSKALIQACEQIVDCLIQKIPNVESGGNVSSPHLIACLKTLQLFAKIKPQLLVKHVHSLQTYLHLNLKCETQEDQQMISCVALTLEVVVPLMENPSDTFLATLEQDLVKLLTQQEPVVIVSCVSCLGSIINSSTRNYKLVRDCFTTYFGVLWNYTKAMKDEIEVSLPIIKRSLYIVGILLRFFHLADMKIADGLEDNILTSVLDTLLFYIKKDSLNTFALKAIGSVCIGHYKLMLRPQLKQLYNEILGDPSVTWQLKTQVLSNIEQYLINEERQMMKQDQEWLKSAKQENLKEMGDVSSGMASTIIQLYLKELLQTCIHSHLAVRQGSSRVVQLIIAQGLVHPVQIVPYLICMCTDEEPTICLCAEQQLQLIERKYPGFVLMKALNGIILSFTLQRILQAQSDVVRGYRLKEDLPVASTGFLYSILQTKQQRRALLLSLLKQFDEQLKTSVLQLLYLADNIATFPYHTLDEPLFVTHHINIMISVTGTNLLKMISENVLKGLLPSPNADKSQVDPITGNSVLVPDEDEDEDVESLLSRLPEDTSSLQECMTACQGCMLLLVLKQHLKTLYNLNDNKIAQYSPSESTKVFETTVNRKNKTRFNPKFILKHIKQGNQSFSPHLGKDAKRAIIYEYLEFKKMVMELDPDDVEEEKQLQVLPRRDRDSTEANPVTADLSCEPTAAGMNDFKHLKELTKQPQQTRQSKRKNCKRKISK